MIFNGPGSVSLGGGISITAPITINSGSLAITGPLPLAGGDLTLNGGTLFPGRGANFGKLSGTGGVLNMGTSFVSFTSASDSTFAGIITGNAPAQSELIKDGTGTLTLTGNSDYAGPTVIAGGILQIGNGGTSGFLAGNFTDNAALIFDRSDSFAYIGDITGTGTLIQEGAGTTTVQGNLALGGITISNGALHLVTSGSLVGNITDNGALILDGGPLTYDGVISGRGSVMTNSVFTLTGANTYSGGTTIGAGTLQLGNGGMSGAIAGSVVDNAALVFDRSDTITFAGAISGTGTVSQSGSGTVTLTSADSYTGGTTVNSGTLRLGNAASLSGSGALIVNGGTFDLNGNTQTVGALSGSGGAIVLGSGSLTANSSVNTSLASGISGDGAFVKAGTGALTLTGISTYTGATNVNAGVLNVTGSIASPTVVVASGATLTGTGKVGATTVASGGTLTPGSSTAAGSLTIAGNLTLASGSNFSDAIMPSGAGLANVSGAASINGNAIANFASGSYPLNQQYTLVTAVGGVSGTFSSFTTTGLPGYLRANLSYDANDVYLNLKPNALAPSLASNTTTNQHSLVAAIDTAVTAGAVPGGGFNALYGLSGASLNSAIDQISGQIGPNVGNEVGQSFFSFLAVTAEGGAGGASNYAPGSAYGAAAAPHRAQLGAGQTRVWGGAYGGHVGLSADAASGAAGLSASNVGLIGGADIALGGGILAGVAFDWGRQHFSSGNGGGVSTDYAFGVYGRADMEAAYVTAAFGYGWHQIATLRVVTVAGTDVLQGKQNADDFGGRIEAGWRVAWDDIYTIAPYGAFAGESFESPAYAETAIAGVSTFALSYAAHTSTLGRSELGAHLDRSYGLGDGTLTADIKGAWAHQLDGRPFAQANFETLATASFQVLGVRPTRDMALLGADLELQYRSGLFLGLKGEGLFGAGTTIVEGLGTFGLRW